MHCRIPLCCLHFCQQTPKSDYVSIADEKKIPDDFEVDIDIANDIGKLSRDSPIRLKRGSNVADLKIEIAKTFGGVTVGELVIYKQMGSGPVELSNKTLISARDKLYAERRE